MQIIAREVELELMRRSAPKQAAADNQKNAPNARDRILQASNKPNHLQKLVAKPIACAKVKETVIIDFFFKFIEFCSIESLQSSSMNEEKIYVWSLEQLTD